MNASRPTYIRWLGKKPYGEIWEAMKNFTINREPNTPDEIWFLEHEGVFTQGQNGKQEHVLNPGDIPVVRTDRGGQVTYHGPGQLMAYVLVDTKRLQLSIRQLVSALEQSVIQYLQVYQVTAYAKCDAPGVYIDQAKISSIGLRIKRGCAYHGIAFNIAMDLEPFNRINPCGFAQLKMTQLSDYVPDMTTHKAAIAFFPYLCRQLKLDHPVMID